MSVDISQVGPGFSDLAFGSQAVFRSCLEAISRPGTIVEVAQDAQVPPGISPAACALLLALLDQDTRLWMPVSPEREATQAIVQRYLRFHTGCHLVSQPGHADFALLEAGRDFPALEQFSNGSEDYPDRSATLVLQAEALRDDRGWTLSGPGIRGKGRLEVGGLDDWFLQQWAQNYKRFPRGVDLYVACGARLAGLPRTTRIEA